MKQCYTDFHFHTNISPDSDEALKNQVDAALQQGVTILCSTDHWDLVDQDSPTLSPPLDRWLAETERVKNLYQQTPELQLLFGIEVGEGYVRPSAVEEALQGLSVDFILGSAHAVDCTDFAKGVSIYHAMGGQRSIPEYREFFQLYFQALLDQSQSNFYDSFGHINYPFRYLPKDCPIVVSDYMEEITAVLENILKQDKVFELNTCRGQTVDVWIPILKRYKELGGKHLTIGSDAHRKEDMSAGIVDSVALLKSLGYEEYVYYQQRQKVLVPIV